MMPHSAVANLIHFSQQTQEPNVFTDQGMDDRSLAQQLQCDLTPWPNNGLGVKMVPIK